MDPLIFEFKNNNCDIEKDVTSYNYQPHYHGNSFKHHSSSTFHHSIWTARAMEKIMWDKTTWFYNELIKDNINEKYFNLTLFLAFYHDVGKLDGRKRVTIKINHPQYGFSEIYGKFKQIGKKMFSCINYPYINTHLQTHKIIAMLAIISLCHQDFGEIMQNKMTIAEYLEKFDENIRNFEPYKFHILDYNMFLRILLLVSLSDVIGSRPIEYNSNYQSKWQILNQQINKVDNNTSPWNHYGYDQRARQICKDIIKMFNKVTNAKLNKNRRGVAAENIQTKIIKRSINGQNFNLLAGVVEKGTILYKAMDTFITQSMHQNYKKASWFASSSTADGYVVNSGVGGPYKYVFESKEDITLIFFDNARNIDTLYQMIIANDRWEEGYKLSIINLIQFAFGINASEQLQMKIKKKFVDNDNINITVQDTFNPGHDGNFKRWSYHHLDVRIMEEVICYFNLGGYMASGIQLSKNVPNYRPSLGPFHEEMAICKSYENVKIKKLEKIIDGNKILNNSVDMINFILKIPNIMDKIIDFQLGGKKKEKKEMIKKNIKKIFGFKIGGNRKNKKIRKHKGINQNTGNLNKGYKYSKKKLKNGLKQIVKK